MTAAVQVRRSHGNLFDFRGTSAALLRGAVVVAVLLALWYAAAWYARATSSQSLTLKLPYPHDVIAYMFQYPETFVWRIFTLPILGPSGSFSRRR